MPKRSIFSNYLRIRNAQGMTGCSIPAQVARFSLKRAQQRLESAKRKRENPDEDEDAEQADAIKEVKKLVNQASEIGDQRPLTCCEFTADGSRLVTASVSGTVKLWEKPGLLGFSKALSIKAHDARVTGEDFRTFRWHTSPTYI